MQKPRVISIAAVSGGGKTTITNQLLNKLTTAKSLHFDDYDLEECPADICHKPHA
jgi:uridine kinase